ncbi:Farnesyl pyrophosphate synthase 1 [Bienertia sinuspersici]
MFLASALGLCLEWLQAYFLVLDDMFDKPHTRRDHILWFRDPKVHMFAAQDGVILRQRIQRVLRMYFREKNYYVDLLDLIHEVEYQTAYGQMNNLLTTIEEEKDLSKYSLDLHRRIVHYKRAKYSFYLPVACALLMSGEKLEDHLDAKNILVDMENHFQIQADYLDCYGERHNCKTGTDIEDYKCSWLVVKALELCNDDQKKVLHENYGKQDPGCVERVKELYNDLNLQGVYAEYEGWSYKRAVKSIESHSSTAMQAVLKSFLVEVYKTQIFRDSESLFIGPLNSS